MHIHTDVVHRQREELHVPMRRSDNVAPIFVYPHSTLCTRAQDLSEILHAKPTAMMKQPQLVLNFFPLILCTYSN